MHSQILLGVKILPAFVTFVTIPSKALLAVGQLLPSDDYDDDGDNDYLLAVHSKRLVALGVKTFPTERGLQVLSPKQNIFHQDVFPNG